MTTDGRRQLPIPREMLDRALGVAHDAVLVGGQALAFWVTRFGVRLGKQPRVYISSDADFLGIREDVARFAAALKAKPIYPNRHELTTLEGMVTVPVGDDAFFSVDVVSKVVGIQGDGVQRRAVEITMSQSGKTRFFVMDPVDCLVSRLENLRTLKEKRNEVGVWQASLAVQVCRKYIEQLLADGDEDKAIKVATAIAGVARHAMGIQAAKQHRLNIIEAVPVSKFAHEKFKTEYWARVSFGLDDLLGAPKRRGAVKRGKPASTGKRTATAASRKR